MTHVTPRITSPGIVFSNTIHCDTADSVLIEVRESGGVEDTWFAVEIGAGDCYVGSFKAFLSPAQLRELVELGAAALLSSATKEAIANAETIPDLSSEAPATPAEIEQKESEAPF